MPKKQHWKQASHAGEGVPGPPRVLRKPQHSPHRQQEMVQGQLQLGAEERMVAILGPACGGGRMTREHTSYWGSSDFRTPLTHPRGGLGS